MALATNNGKYHLPATIAKPRIFMLGATGTIGRAVVRVLQSRGYETVCFVRKGATVPDGMPGLEFRQGDAGDPKSLVKDGFRGENFDVMISCMASRTGEPLDAWKIDYAAHMHALDAAKSAGVKHIVLLSAICLQKPRLAFQHAKLSFEQALIQSGLGYSIVRPTAYFKSLSGQVERVKRGKPFLVFADGELTACKPVSDGDLARYIVSCIDDTDMHGRILPVGGPGPAITPREQGEMLFSLLGKEPRFKHVPLWVMDAVIAVLDATGKLFPAAARKAELARIGRYYATESMLVLDSETGRYDADMTPETGTDTLRDHYEGLIKGEIKAERGDHAVF